MIQNIIVYINGHLTEVLDTDTLSSMSGLSKFHFRRVFRTATGENIGSYIQRCTSADLYGLYAKANHRANELSD